MKNANDIVVVSGVRTAIGTMGGSFKDTHQHDLGAAVIREAVARAGLQPAQIDEVVVGNVGQIAESGFIARICQLRAGLPNETTSYSVNRQCGSGLQAIVDCMLELQTGNAEITVACGTENMTQLPHYIRKARYGYRLGHGELEDGIVSILTWPEGPYHNGMTAEFVAERFHISREAMDEFAWCSQQKALAAIKEGHFTSQILPLEVREGKNSRLFATDEHPRDTPKEKYAQLKPAFKKDGTVTAATSSGINDGAAALVVTTRANAEKLGLPIRMVIRGWAVAGCEAEIMGFGPAPATRKLMQKLNMSVHDIDLIELNEAFAAQSLAVINDLELDPAKVNVNGGAIALGHPVGASGAIIAVKLMYEMERRGVNTGLATMCIGGGQGISMLFERER
ncbi:thiolase family protein [Serratia fonticola]|jgi:acetyl-CoA C-acetyltransferase|uniref:thiolase family protein n=1 Tax=Serratia fonticola TaxID=47917 RepID=UPI001576567B|nr:thiolase family protein [Serratia fonticola]MBL5827613.1 thiolase family protein [Serratia fonticola]NTY87443.1 thiolase family protein [Serratia fonticola]NTZ13114.1 thiolase family protein [Serratia fonticola]CAI0969523.1 Acetyl-CoA acetyltransferase [Serratia fonticola]CAI1870265.1 Acetyl-CoA acetyltransferase [Serratia fonticola]